MYNIQGFYRLSRLADNNVGVTATFGELSSQALTYSTEIRDYKYADYPNTELVTTQVINQIGQAVQITTALSKKLTAIGEWLFNQHTTGAIPADSGREQFFASIQTEFADMEWLALGAFIRSAQNSYYMPTFVELKVVDSGNTYHVKIWLSNANFLNEYEPYSLFIIPPVDNIEQFINNSTIVNGLLNANTPTNVINKYNTIRGNNPETRFDTFSLTYHDPNDSAVTLNTVWSYVAYGAQGTNVDNIKTAIRDYLSGNSTYTEWNKIFPSLYEQNDFTLIPLWDKIAVAETQLDQNLYASYTAISGLLDLVKAKVPSSYGSVANINAHVNANLELFATFYRGMLFGALANPNNINSTKRLSILYPSYTSEGVDSPDFERMPENTRLFSERLNFVLEKARLYKSNDTVPAGLYRVSRNNKVYLAFLHDDFQFFVLTRESFFS